MADDPIWADQTPEYDAFFEAVCQGNVDELGAILASASTVQVNALTRRDGYDYEAESALHMASARGHVSVVKTLLDHGADVNIYNREVFVDYTPLLSAAVYAHGDVIRVLLDRGADVTVRGPMDGTALHQVFRSTKALSQAHFDSVEILLAGGVELHASSEEFEGTVLHVAASQGQFKMVELLLDRGADPNLKTSYGRSVLYSAASRGHYAMVELLINRGAKVDGSLAFTAAAGQGDMAIVQLLLRHTDQSMNEAESGALRAAAYCGKTDMVEFLLSRGFDMEARDPWGNTPLLATCGADHPSAEVVSLLLKNGADIEAKNAEGQGPLHQAAWRSELPLIQTLLTNGADVMTRNDKGRTPLITYAENIWRNTNAVGYENNLRAEGIKLLLDTDADPNAKDHKGRTALHELVSHTTGRRGEPRIVEATQSLLMAGADVNVRDAEGMRALGIARREPHPDLPRLLLEFGAEE
ncbi:MAG: hypothetical protein M1817_003677 [Caeruleum heppii]|nr:MAG: hypothetical protein M1817_003677 [Caeruleum heppii]